MSTNYTDRKKVALLLSPEVLTAFDNLLAKNSRMMSLAKGNQFMEPEASAVPVWTVGYNDNTVDENRTLAYVLGLPNSPKRKISRLIVGSGKYQEPSVQLEFNSGFREGWTASCRGDNKDVLAFRDEFDQLIHTAVPRYNFLANLDLGFGYLVGSMTLGSGFTLLTSKLPLELGRTVTVAGLGIVALTFAYGLAREHVFPMFETTIGDGARRHKVRDGWRGWVSAGFASVLFGLVGSAIWAAITVRVPPPSTVDDVVVVPPGTVIKREGFP